MKVVIIDDENKSRKLLSILLTDNCPEVKEIEEASDLPTGVRLIKKTKPDIVFLDIEMPGYLGIQILDFFLPEEIDFQLVFATAYSEYAIKAFELNAIDYLLKPLRIERVVQVIEKVKKNKDKDKFNQRLEVLRASWGEGGFTKIGIPVADGILFVEFKDIILLSADKMYTTVYTTKHGDLVVSKPMKYFLDKLEPFNIFYRPHRSFLINLDFIKKYISKDGGYLEMENKERVAISREKKRELLKILGKE